MRRLVFVLALVFLMISVQGCSEAFMPTVQTTTPQQPQQKAESSQNNQSVAQPQKKADTKVTTPAPVATKKAPVQTKEVLLSSSQIVFADGDSANTYNAIIALKAINGKVIESGQVFSFNKMVGERTEAKGYIAGYDAKNNVVDGGGVCRIATLKYQAALDGGLEIIERHPHVPAITYAPPGRDATVDYNSGMDLKFRNTSGCTLKIYTSSKKQGNSAVLEVRLVKLQPVK